MFTFQVGIDAGDHLIVAIHGRPDERDDWLDSTVTVSAGAFAGSYNAVLTTCDFPRFRQELQRLYDTLEGVARFSTIERQIAITLSANSRGCISVEGSAEDAIADGNSLKFRFETDQTFLPPLIRQIREIEMQYPNRLHPPFPP
jgi:hypothetical protein